MEANANFVETSDAGIYYEVSGTSKGHPLVLVNGGPGAAHSYLKLSGAWDRLGSSRPVIFYDQRGTGRSRSSSADDDLFGILDQLFDLEALRDHLAFDQIDLLGHSFGGFLCMAYTALYAPRVRRLVLVDSVAPHLQDSDALFKSVYPEVVERRKAQAFGVDLGDKDAIMRDLEQYYSMLFWSVDMRDRFVPKIDPRWTNANVSRQLWQDGERFDLTPELSKFTQPTLVISGRFDMNIPTRVGYGIHKCIPDSIFEVFERSGHVPFFEEEDHFVQTVDEFLSRS